MKSNKENTDQFKCTCFWSYENKVDAWFNPGKHLEKELCGKKNVTVIIFDCKLFLKMCVYRI